MTKNIEDLENGAWENIEAEVLTIWENEHPAIRQVGLLKDATGIVKFVSWEKSNLPLVEEGITYQFLGVPVTSYNDRLSASLVRTTVITRVSEQRQETLPTV